MRADRFASALLVGASLFAFATEALAYCRTTTVPSSPSGDTCSGVGRPIYWKSACVGYRLSSAASRQVTLAQAAGVVARAFAAWTLPNATCSPSIGVVALAPTASREVGYITGQPNENIVVFRDDDWEHGDSALELVTTTYLVDTGEIRDADIEINTRDNVFGVEPAADAGSDAPFDLRFVMTHAAGHFVGFAHAADPASVMWPQANPGPKTMPFLTADDEQGACAVYPESGVRTTTDAMGESIEVASSACNLSAMLEPGPCGQLEVKHGCSIDPRGGEATSGAASIATMILAALLARKRLASVAPPK